MLPIVLFTGAVVALLVKASLASNPSSRSFQLFERLSLSFLALHVWNAIAGMSGLTLGVNVLTLGTVSWLGLPGLAVLAAIRGMT